MKNPKQICRFFLGGGYPLVVLLFIKINNIEDLRSSEKKKKNCLNTNRVMDRNS